MELSSLFLVHVFNEGVDVSGAGAHQRTVFRYLRKLSVEELEALNDAIRSVGFYSSGVDLFYSVQLNVEDLLSSILGVTDRYMKEGVMGEIHMDMASLSFSRLTLNLLGMFKSFLDHGASSIERKFGPGSVHSVEWKRRQSSEYDRSSAYRLFSNLRNYCQHVGMPPIHFSIEQSNEVEGVTVVMEFVRDELLSTYKRWSRDAKNDLQTGPETISLLGALQEWSESFLRLARWFSDLRRESAMAGANLIMSLRDNFDLPLEGQLALMEEPKDNSQSDGVNFKARWISESKAKNVIDGVPYIEV